MAEWHFYGRWIAGSIFTSLIAKRFSEKRRKGQIQHDYLSLLRHRVYALCLGYEDLNDNLYCARGDMENRIKEQQLGLFAERTSCRKWWPNHFRLLLSSLAYVLLESIRRLYLSNNELARIQVGTIRLQLLKIGAVIIRNTRRIPVLLSDSYPHQKLFTKVATLLAPG